MTSDGTIFLTVALLSLGVVSLVLAAVVGSFSVHGGRRRAGILAILGIFALLAMAFVVQGLSWDTIWSDILWPTAVISGGAAGGLAAGLGLIYLLVAQQ